MNTRPITLLFLVTVLAAGIFSVIPIQYAAATHLPLVSHLGSGTTGISVTPDGVMSDIDGGVIIIDDFLQVGISSITIDGDGVLSEIISTVSLTIVTTTGTLSLTSTTGGITLTSTDGPIEIASDITGTVGTIFIESNSGGIAISAGADAADPGVDSFMGIKANTPEKRIVVARIIGITKLLIKPG